MDHLPMPPNPYNPIIIPYYEIDKKFDGGDLITFPGRCGKKITDFIASKDQFMDRRSLHELEVFLTETDLRLSKDLKTENNDVYARLLHAVNIISKSLTRGEEDVAKKEMDLNAHMAALSTRDAEITTAAQAKQAEDEVAKASKSFFWIDHNVAQARDYLFQHLKDTMEDKEGALIAYCWNLVLQTLTFLVPALDRTEDYDSDEEVIEGPESNADVNVTTDQTEGSTSVTELGTLEDLGVLSMDFCKLVLETLHKTFPDEVPDLPTIIGRIDSPAQMGFLAQWLFFGTLHKAFEAIEVPIDLQRYISTDGEVPVLTTRYLDEDLKLWEDIELTRSYGQARRQQRLTEMLVDVVMFAMKISERANSEKIADFLTAVHSLCITLEVKATRLYGGETGVLGTRNQWLGEKLKKSGWCPHQATILLDSYILTMVYYIYLLGPPKKPHDTSKCSQWSCALNNIQDYETLHSSMCTNGDFCAMTKIHYDDDLQESGNVYVSDQEKLSSIVNSGKIPLISLGHPVFDSMVSLDIEFEPYDPESDVQYVAISHVWADGMGNNESNSISLCQLQDLRILVRNIIGDSRARRFHLWIDTLCVPVSPPDERKAAILQMRKIYESAAIVLVLDSELRSHQLSSDLVETLARVVSSRWARRLWTFQEAALAQNLFFQFKDQCVSMQQIYEAVEPQRNLFNPWSLFDVGWWPTMRSARDNQMIIKHALTDPEVAAILTEEKRIQYQAVLDQFEEVDNSLSVVWRGIKLRATQKAEDEVICVATLLDLDLSVIFSTPIEDRRKKLFLMQRKIPSSILFTRMRRMLDDGFRWAPKSFMGKAFIRDSFSAKGIVTEEGLLVTYPGILFRGNPVRIVPEVIDYNFVFDKDPKDGSTAEPKKLIPFSLSLGLERLEAFEGDVIVRDWGSFDTSTYALILSQPLLTLDSESMEGAHRCFGALVSVYDDSEEGGLLKVRYLEQVIVTRGIIRKEFETKKAKVRRPAPTSASHEAGKQENARIVEEKVGTVKKRTTWERTFGPVAGTIPLKNTRLANPTLLPPTQRWCVG